MVLGGYRVVWMIESRGVRLEGQVARAGKIQHVPVSKLGPYAGHAR